MDSHTSLKRHRALMLKIDLWPFRKRWVLKNCAYTCIEKLQLCNRSNLVNWHKMLLSCSLWLERLFANVFIDLPKANAYMNIYHKQINYAMPRTTQR